MCGFYVLFILWLWTFITQQKSKTQTLNWSGRPLTFTILQHLNSSPRIKRIVSQDYVSIFRVVNISVHCAAFSEPTLKEKYVPRRRGNLKKKLKKPYSSLFEYRTNGLYTLRLPTVPRECHTASNLCFYKPHMREFCIFMRAEDWIVLRFIYTFFTYFSYIIHKQKDRLVGIV
jgi:hypothetical protein